MLPEPTGPFEWVQTPAGPALVCRPLAGIAPHLFTTRAWTLGSRAAATDTAWNEVAAAMRVDSRHLVRLHQVHGTALVVRRAGSAAEPANPATIERPDADIVVSDDPALALAIQTADCVPLLIADRRTGHVAAAHAGWRGLAARVPAIAVDALARLFDSKPSDLIAAIGPSIGACCYEVGDEVRSRFADAGFSRDQLARWFVGGPQPSARNPSMAGLPPTRRAGHWFFDGWTAAREQLIAAAMTADQIHSADLCTASHADVFCSYRRDGAPAGRLAAVVRPHSGTAVPP